MDDLREDIYDFVDHCVLSDPRNDIIGREGSNDHCLKIKDFNQCKYARAEFFAQAFDYEGGNVSGGIAYLKHEAVLITVMPDMSLRPLFQFFKSVKASVGPNSKFEKEMLEKFDTETGRRHLGTTQARAELISSIWKSEVSNESSSPIEELTKAFDALTLEDEVELTQYEKFCQTFNEEHEAHKTFVATDLELTNNMMTGRFRRDEEVTKWLNKQQLEIADRALLYLHKTKIHIVNNWDRFMEKETFDKNFTEDYATIMETGSLPRP